MDLLVWFAIIWMLVCIHEAAHAGMAVALGGRILEFKVWPHRARGNLGNLLWASGSVVYIIDHTNKNTFLIAVAPVFPATILAFLMPVGWVFDNQCLAGCWLLAGFLSGALAYGGLCLDTWADPETDGSVIARTAGISKMQMRLCCVGAAAGWWLEIQFVDWLLNQ